MYSHSALKNRISRQQRKERPFNIPNATTLFASFHVWNASFNQFMRCSFVERNFLPSKGDTLFKGRHECRFCRFISFRKQKVLFTRRQWQGFGSSEIKHVHLIAADTENRRIRSFHGTCFTDNPNVNAP